MPYIIYYLIAINVVAFAVTAADKFTARQGWRRVPERTLFGLAIVGGAVGVWLAMQLFRHKTLHKTFTMGIPLIFIVQVALVCLYKFVGQ